MAKKIIRVNLSRRLVQKIKLNSTIAQEDIKSDLFDKPESWKKYYLSFTALLWGSLWFGINTGPWVLSSKPESFIEFINYLRTILPFFVLIIAAHCSLTNKKGDVASPVRACQILAGIWPRQPFRMCNVTEPMGCRILGLYLSFCFCGDERVY